MGGFGSGKWSNILTRMAAVEQCRVLSMKQLRLGGLFGVFFPELALQQKIIGAAFIAFLKMLVVPLVFASIYVAILGLGSLEHLKNIGHETTAIQHFHLF